MAHVPTGFTNTFWFLWNAAFAMGPVSSPYLPVIITRAGLDAGETGQERPARFRNQALGSVASGSPHQRGRAGRREPSTTLPPLHRYAGPSRPSGSIGTSSMSR